MSEAALLAAWKRWDDSCALAAKNADDKKAREGDEYRPHPTGPSPSAAEQMEDACKAYAPTLDLTSTQLRALLMAWRVAGRTREVSLRAVLAGVAA